MPYTIVRQQVDDFPKWRRSFEEHAEEREEAGSRGGHIFRNHDDGSEVVVFLAWEDLDRAREYLTSDAMDEERREGEFRGDPEILYLEELGRPKK